MGSNVSHVACYNRVNVRVGKGVPDGEEKFLGLGHGVGRTDDRTSRRGAAARLSIQYGRPIETVPAPKLANLNLRKPCITPPASVASFCSTGTHDRAVHSYGRGFRDRVRAFNGQFPNPPDVVAYPRNEQEVISALEWCSKSGAYRYTLRRGKLGGGGSGAARRFERRGVHRYIIPRPGAGNR